MHDTLTAEDYERLADTELTAAAAADAALRRTHLDQAAVYATLAETIRRDTEWT